MLYRYGCSWIKLSFEAYLSHIANHERTHILVLPQVVGLGLAKIAQVAQGEFVAADGDAEG